MDILTEGKISKDVERSARKLGIKFKKITADITTNKYSNPTGDMKKYGKDHERVRMNQWMADVGGGTGLTKDNYEEAGEKLIKMLKSKYKLLKLQKFTSGKVARFINRKKDPRSEFRISYAKTAAGPYISYEGVYGE